jgi:hypothetical protein
VVLVLCGPWYATHWDMVQYASQPLPPSGAWRPASTSNLSAILAQAGAMFVPFAILGIYSRVVAPGDDRRAMWGSFLALGASVWVFHSLLYPSFSSRYLLPACAVYVLFCVAGMHALTTRLTVLRPAVLRSPVPIVLCALAVFLVAVFHVPVKTARGFARAADTMLAEGLPPNVTALVSSDPVGEGAFVAEVATRAPDRRTMVLRASKLLATSTWMGANYALKYLSDEALLDALDRARVEYVALDDASDEAHHRQLRAAVERSNKWAMVPRAMASIAQGGHAARLYRRVVALPPKLPEFEIDMGYSLRTTLRP